MIRNCLDNGHLTLLGKVSFLEKCIVFKIINVILDSEPENIVLYPYLKRTVCCQNMKSFR